MIKTILALLGQFALAYNVSMALHELGHAVGLVLSGGQVAHITLNPFCWCWTWYATNPRPIVTAWSGVVVGVLFALLPCIALATFGRRTPRLFVLLGIVALAANGIYLLDGVLSNVGDGADIVDLGAPRLLPITVGAILVLAAALWFILVQPKIGIPSSASFPRRTALLCGGIGTYLVLMMLYVAVYHSQELSCFACFAGAGVALLIAMSVAATLADKYLSGRWEGSSVEAVSWPYAIGYFSAGTVIVIAEIAVFGR